jgi:hypothetical protein
MNVIVNDITTNETFKKSLKGEIVVVGSGKFLREQKKLLSDSNVVPFEELYKQQVQDVLKDSSPEIIACFSF